MTPNELPFCTRELRSFGKRRNKKSAVFRTAVPLAFPKKASKMADKAYASSAVFFIRQEYSLPHPIRPFRTENNWNRPIPLDWDYSIPYGLLYSLNAPEDVVEFVKTVSVRIPGEPQKPSA